MKWRVLLLPLAAALLALCPACASQDDTRLSALCDEAYRVRYSDVTRSQQAARAVLSQTEPGSDSHAEALNHMAYVAYQQMRYDQALHLVQEVQEGSRNQLEKLCADVMTMKVMQRIGHGKAFFDSRLRAGQRLRRILSEQDDITPHQRQRLHYAATEFRIIGSTYYYYLGQEEAARREIGLAAEDVDLQTDTTQWLYYHYMLGSGGLTEGSREEVTVTEFDHLFRVYTLAKAAGSTYFEANALQSLASMVSDSITADLLKQQRLDAYSYLYGEHLRWQLSAPRTTSPRFRFAEAMADHAIVLFRRYRDLFQTACALRTLGEVYFQAGRYEAARSAFLRALHLASGHSRSPYQVTPWLAGIHEKLSLTYSALGDKASADAHRSTYLDLLDQSRQNRELDSRKTLLAHELRVERVQFLLLVVLLVAVIALSILYYRQLKRRSHSAEQRLRLVAESPAGSQATLRLQTRLRQLEDDLSERNDEYAMLQQRIAQQQSRHILQRTKLSVVYAIIPYLDRVIAEVRSLAAGHGDAKARLGYIRELCDGMMAINDRLTEWIQVQKGRVQLHVTRFPLGEVLDVIRMQQSAFSRQQLTLQVPDTDLQVKADKPLTAFMINTLVDNARKFTPAGGTVSVRLDATEAYVEVSICDTGIGLRPEDVDTLNGSKVYDSSHLGLSQDGKGFGFGIMNCKGIINSYRKLSSLFQVCDFGVESTVGQGSRFWFRLPRVLVLLWGLVLDLSVEAAPSRCYHLYDSVYAANLQGRYADACHYADSALRLMEAPVDTPLLVSIYNEKAIACQALCRWDAYRHSNAECVRLHRLYSTDASLATDCQRLERMSADSKVLYVLLVLLALASLTLFYLVVLRRRRRHHASLDAVYMKLVSVLDQLPEGGVAAAQTLHAVSRQLQQPSLRTAIDALCRDLTAQLSLADERAAAIETATDRLQKLRFEHDRLYVMNQILDNALSTIKHETMYFPSRIRQLADGMQLSGIDAEALQSLQDMVAYYRQIYMLLYDQACRQTDQSGLRRRPVSLAELFASAAQSHGCTFLPTDVQVIGDAVLLHLLVDQLLTAVQGQAELSAERQGDMVSVCCRVTGDALSEAQAEALFTPMTDRLPCLVMRQILRQHDAACGHPGLRLTACPTADGYTITFTLKAIT